jgi:hypothetical protein
MGLASFGLWRLEMSPRDKEFLAGFARAALLTAAVLKSAPSQVTADAYLEAVARLLRDSQDLVGRGVAVGCLAALGKS